MATNVAVITPYYKEPDEVLLQCHESVLKQAGDFKIKHFMIADGHPNSKVLSWDCNHTTLDESHSDNGNTPRAIGCLLAKNEGHNFISFLDADNWYHQNHINSLLQTFKNKKLPITTSFRTFHQQNGEQLNITEKGEDSLSHVDTSCILLHRSAFHLNAIWSEMPKQLSPICDRIFMAGIRHRQLRFASTMQRSVAFRTQYKDHYVSAGLKPPSDAKGSEDLRPAFTYLKTQKGITECINALRFWPMSYL